MNMKARTTLQQNGLTLIEVLVALFVLSVGLLGLAGLQATGSKFNNSAYLRTQAYIQAYDIADRMRNNLVAVNAANLLDENNNNAALPDDNYNDPPTAAEVEAQGSLSHNCVSSTCTPGEMATYDMEVWQKTNSLLLPEGNGSIVNNGNGTFTITITWNEEFTRTKSVADATSLSRTLSIDFVP